MTASYHIWIEEGYKLFAEEGPPGINVEKLAKRIGYNKSGFYHYFGDQDLFLSKIISHHGIVGEQFANEIAGLKKFDPDYLELIIKFRIAFMFQMQLRKNMNNKMFNESFVLMEKQNERARNKLWSDYLGIHDNPELSLKMWEMMRDMLFMRAPKVHLSIEFLRKIVSEVKNVVNQLKAKET